MNTELKGKRVVLINMKDEFYSKLKMGDEGTIQFVDDINQIHVKWDNGEGLALVPEVDKFIIKDI